MRGDRIKRVSEQLQQIAAEFFAKHANRSALLTVTKARVSKDFKNATIYFTIFPESKEKAALDFAIRHGSELREYTKKQLSIKTIPFFHFEIDRGEKNFYSVIETLND